MFPAFSPDGRWLAVEDIARRTLTLFDAATGRTVWSRKRGAAGPAALAFSPDNTTLAVGYGAAVAGVVEFRDIETGDVRRTLPTLSVGRVEFLRGGSVVMTTGNVGGKSVAQLWDAATLAPIGEPMPQPYGAYSLVRSPDGTTAIAGTSEGVVTIWNVGIENWKATACRIAGRNLTKAEWRRYLADEPYQRTCLQWPDDS
jgi:WD40 repeat protein